MMGHKTGVGKRIQDLQPKAYPTHCHGHSLSLRVKDITYAKMESLLIKTLNSQDKSEELKFMEKLYTDDVNISVFKFPSRILL